MAGCNNCLGSNLPEVGAIGITCALAVWPRDADVAEVAALLTDTGLGHSCHAVLVVAFHVECGVWTDVDHGSDDAVQAGFDVLWGVAQLAVEGLCGFVRSPVTDTGL